MPGAMHRMGVYLGLVEEDEQEYETAYAGAPERTPARREEYAEARYSREQSPRAEVAYGRPARQQYDEEVYAEVRGPAYDEQPTYQITALHPRTYNEARTIGEHFRTNTPVIMNLSDMEDADAKRLVDFAAGLTFGLRGRLERVTAKVFLLSPANVQVTDSDKAKIESGFFNQS
ncbi:MAG: cell division protein SepF [Jatrophihabitans sp.]|uniref:cell division protein SepF n=1 Tax=Jatrophihabitans sp. TaxID=1932789 RepID=UPI003F7DBB61